MTQSTPVHLFFWEGVFSNFHPIGGDDSFTSEKIYMAQKAMALLHLNRQPARLVEGVGCILNGIDLIDDEVAESSAPLFDELHRRFKK